MDIESRPSAGHRLGLIASVSPSRAAALLSCKLSEALRAGRPNPVLPTHPNAHFGVLVHKFVERASRGEFGIMNSADASTRWCEAVRVYESELSKIVTEMSVLPFESSCDDFEVNSLLAIKAAVKASETTKALTQANLPTGSEVELSSRDDWVVGRADRIQWEDGKLGIVDLKTGKLAEANGAIRAELVMQVKLYAYLVYDRTGRWPDFLKLQDLQGRTTEVAFSPSDVLSLADRVKTARLEANAQIARIQNGEIDELSLASPSPRACRFCRYRLGCGAYWTARETSAETGWAADLEGILVAINPIGPSHLVAELEISGGVATVRGPAAKLNDIVTQSVAMLGAKTRICELKAERAPRTFSCKHITALAQA